MPKRIVDTPRLPIGIIVPSNHELESVEDVGFINVANITATKGEIKSSNLT